MATELNKIERKTIQEPSQEKRKPKKIALFTFLCMLCTAILLDIFSLVPGLNVLVMILGNVLFLVWFYLLGIQFTSKRLSSFGVSGLIEIIPILSILPGNILNVCINYYLD